MKIEMYDKLEAMCDKLKVEKQLMQSELERLREKHESLLLVTGNYVFNLILFFLINFKFIHMKTKMKRGESLDFAKLILRILQEKMIFLVWQLNKITNKKYSFIFYFI